MRIVSKTIAGQLGVVTKNVVPVKAEADSSWSTETISQALIGQPVIAEAGQGNWLFVQMWDTYRGWIQSKSVRMLEDQSRPYASSGAVAIIRELFVDIFEKSNSKSAIITKATISAELEVMSTDGDWVELITPDGRTGFIKNHDAKLIEKENAHTIWLPEPRKLVETACRFIGVPYQWGGASSFGLDCSGFMQLVHRIHGVTLLRDAHMQAEDERGETVEKSSIKAGDLVFFSSTDSKSKAIAHVGMAIGNKRFIHSCGDFGVMISPLSDPQYNERYWGAKRMRLSTLDAGGGAPEG